MTKESDEKPDVKNDNTVSTPIEISQNTLEKNNSVKFDPTLSSNSNNNGGNKIMNSKENSEVLQITKGDLDSIRIGNGVVSGSNEGVKDISKEKSSDKGEEIEEDDVPGDFFDDFLKEDFMDGLDIVDDDAWDEDKMKKHATAGETPKKNEKKVEKDKLKKKKQKSTEKIDHLKKFLQSPPGEKRHKQKKKKHDDKPSEQKPKKSKEKSIDADEFDIRRDPEKTKRDIERDKARCEKDKEKKIISEKLSLVETGLVPPGMEMEIDIEEVKRQKERIELNKPPRDLREHLRSLRSRSKSSTRRLRSPKIGLNRKSVSPLKRPSPKRRRTRSPIRGRSPGRLSSPKSSLKRSPLTTSSLRRSPLRRSSPRRISPRRSPLRNPLFKSQDRNYGEKRPVRRSRSHSPFYRGRRNRYSPVHQRHRGRSSSRDSDREIWLKRRRSRSRSPRRKRDEKKSFLQEIAEKLNETRPQPVNVMPPLQPTMHFLHSQPMQPAPVPVPAPVPPPSNSYFTPQPQPQPQPQLQPQPQPQSQQQYDPYDQNFFIGTPQPVRPPTFLGQPQPQPVPSGQSQLQLPLQSIVAQTSSHPTLIGSNVSKVLENFSPQPQGKPKIDSKEGIEKLFQDKKITLSEFLAVTAKPEVSSSSPAHLQEKIKVISRCQEAIKILGLNEKKYTGKLVIHRTDNYKLSTQKNKSPLTRMPPVIFPFTQHQIKMDQKTTFTNFINQLLQKLGLLADTVVEIDKEILPNVSISSLGRNLSPPPPPLITKNRNFVNETLTPRSCMLGNNQLSKMVQTDVFKCESCEKRKKILYKTSGVQCGGDSVTFSVSTQVTESDFYSKIPITQSLASLTPAQLLAKSRSALDSSSSPAKFSRAMDKDDFDIHVNKSSFSTLRNNFARSTDMYNLPRYSPPSPSHYLPAREELVPPSAYNNLTSLRTQFIGGGGRGRGPQPNSSRPLAPNNRFNYNNYF